MSDYEILHQSETSCFYKKDNHTIVISISNNRLVASSHFHDISKSTNYAPEHLVEDLEYIGIASQETMDELNKINSMTL